MTDREVAIVVGAGPGLGNALVRRFAEAGMSVAAVTRKGRHTPEAPGYGDLVHGYACDATIGDQVTAMFAQVSKDLGQPNLVVFNVGTWDRAGILDISDNLFEEAWRTGCFGGFLVGRAAAASMLPFGRGTIILPVPPGLSVAALVLQPSRCPSSAFAPWPRVWRVNSAQKAFT